MDQTSDCENYSIENVESALSREIPIERRYNMMQELERNVGLFIGHCEPELTSPSMNLFSDPRNLIRISIRSKYEEQYAIKQYLLCFSGSVLVLEVNERPDLEKPVIIDGVGHFQFYRKPMIAASDDSYVLQTSNGKYRMFIDVTNQLNPRRPDGIVRLMNIKDKFGKIISMVIDFLRSEQPERLVFTISVDNLTNVLSDVAINEQSLPSKPEFSPIVFSEEHEDVQQCSVCLDDFIVGRSLTKLICGHIFHEQCISTWLFNHSTCPICYERLFENYLRLFSITRDGDDFLVKYAENFC